MQKYLPIVIGAVVFGAFILLMLVFRSILVPLKAAIMNLLSIAAAYGVVVLVFQWGWARQIVGLTETIPIVSFVPLVMFVILFGLSMDYEVFLMSRMKEIWDSTHDPRQSVILGVATTGRVITTAALIMMAVFFSFVASPSPTVKLIGFGIPQRRAQFQLRANFRPKSSANRLALRLIKIRTSRVVLGHLSPYSAASASCSASSARTLPISRAAICAIKSANTSFDRAPGCEYMSIPSRNIMRVGMD